MKQRKKQILLIQRRIMPSHPIKQTATALIRIIQATAAIPLTKETAPQEMVLLIRTIPAAMDLPVMEIPVPIKTMVPIRTIKTTIIKITTKTIAATMARTIARSRRSIPINMQRLSQSRRPVQKMVRSCISVHVVRAIQRSSLRQAISMITAQLSKKQHVQRKARRLTSAPNVTR